MQRVAWGVQGLGSPASSEWQGLDAYVEMELDQSELGPTAKR